MLEFVWGHAVITCKYAQEFFLSFIQTEIEEAINFTESDDLWPENMHLHRTRNYEAHSKQSLYK